MGVVVGRRKNSGNGIVAIILALDRRRPSHRRTEPRIGMSKVVLNVRYPRLGRIAPVPLDDRPATTRQFALDIELSLALDGIRVDGFERHGAILDGGAVHQIDKFGEDVHFEFQFDAVEQDLEAFLVELHVAELHDQQRDIHANDDDVDGQHLAHHAPGILLRDDLEQTVGFPHVEARDDQFLQREDGDLDEFDVIIPDQIIHVARVGTPPVEDIDDREDDTTVDDNHPLDGLQDPVIIHQQAEPRVQHETLARNHGHPAHGDQDLGRPQHGQFPIVGHHAERVRRDAEVAQRQRPEVQAAPSFEGRQDQQCQFDAVVQC